MRIQEATIPGNPLLADQKSLASPKYKWELLVLLWLAFFLNQADRQIFSVVLPLIKAELHLTDGELGLIASALVWTYGLLVPVAGFVGDRWSRKNITAISPLRMIPTYTAV